MIDRKCIIFIVLWILAILNVGCAQNIDDLPKETKNEPVPSNTAALTSTSTSPAVVATPTPIRTPIGDLDCRPVGTNPDFKGKGFLIVSDSRGVYYLVDMQTLAIEKLAENSMSMAFSPYSQAFAYFSLEEELLIIKSQRGTITLPWEHTWFSIARWLDEENIQINENHTSTSPQIILNPFSGNSTRLVPAFEDIYSLDSNLNWDGLSLVSYSPNLRFAVYPRSGRDELALVLVPTYTDGLRARLFPIDITSRPEWSPYGEFAVGEPLAIDARGQLMGYELFLVGLGGEIRKITNFSETYDYPVIDAYRWSPSYSDIAFWFTGERYQSRKAYLGIVNTKSQETYLLCITVQNINLAFPPVWSPDQGLLAVNAEIDGSNKLIIIDLATLEYRELDFDFNAIPVGWVSFKP
jgi:hypothetical protein